MIRIITHESRIQIPDHVIENHEIKNRNKELRILKHEIFRLNLLPRIISFET